MITELIINVFLFPVRLLLTLLSNYGIDISIPDNVFNALSDIVSGVTYVFPIFALLPIFGVKLSLYIFKIVVAIIVRTKSFIPTMGS